MNVFFWKDFGSWKDTISDCIEDLYTGDELIEIFKESNDPLSEFEQSEFDYICKTIWTHFTHLKAFHSSKPIDPRKIHSEGLNPLNVEDKIKEFKQIFPQQRYGITDQDIEYSIKKLGEGEVYGIRAGVICAVLDDRIFQKRGSGQFLIYGSEFLLNLTLYLPKKFSPTSLTDVGLERGIPTIFTVVYPTKLLSKKEQTDIVLKMLGEWAAWYGEPVTESDRIGYTLHIKEQIPGDYIVSHSHPKAVENSLYGLYGPRIYKPTIECTMCSNI